jgi:peptidoglycan-associated lipoprotein
MTRLQSLIALAAAAFAASSAIAQVAPTMAPPGPAPAATEPQELPLLQNDLVLKAGSDRVFFAGNDYAVSPASRATLMAQARWLLANPSARAIVEGHSDERDTRDHALALGERRASAVRNYLVSLGVPPARLIVTSMGKERPVTPLPGYPASGISARVVLVIVR